MAKKHMRDHSKKKRACERPHLKPIIIAEKLALQPSLLGKCWPYTHARMHHENQPTHTHAHTQKKGYRHTNQKRIHIHKPKKKVSTLFSHMYISEHTLNHGEHVIYLEKNNLCFKRLSTIKVLLVKCKEQQKGNGESALGNSYPLLAV